VWVNNKEMTYSNWDLGEPDDSLDCVYLSNESYWKTTSCQATGFEAHYICEIPGQFVAKQIFVF